MAELQPNSDSQPPLQEESVFIPGVGNAVIASNDFGPDFNAKQCVSSLFDEQGKFVPTTRIDGGVRQVPGQDFVVREQLAKGDTAALTETVRAHAQEINTVRGLGLAVVRHLSVVLPVSDIDHPEEMKNEPSIITIAEKIPNQNDKRTNLDPRNPENAAKIARITSTLQKYYTDDRERPHLADISQHGQYSSDGALLDLDMACTETVGLDMEESYETCGKQLDEMYKSFALSDNQVAELQKDHSTNYRPTGESMSPSLQQIYAHFEAVEARTEEAIRFLQVASEFAQEAEDAIRSTGEWVSREQGVIVQTAHYWEGTRTGIENLTEMFKVALERMWKSFPKI